MYRHLSLYMSVYIYVCLIYAAELKFRIHLDETWHVDIFLPSSD